LDNTYIIFTSDNGFHLGQHRQTSGKAGPYEEDIHVPFFIRGPGIEAGTTLPSYLATNIDLPVTFAGLAGVLPPEFVDGRSLVPLFFMDQRPPLQEWRKAVLIEFFGNRGEETGVLPFVYSGIRTEDFVYVEFDEGWVELYDLVNDPYQLHNLALEDPPNEMQVFSDWLAQLRECAGSVCVDLENDPPE
jgi:arylsulfatase A-like enzyme